jgi:anthranilate synthase/aminodeoxychorismate synthase-like glutamine amidotransferase
MIVLIDNYDSFTYNLLQYLGELGEEVRVFRNDQIGISQVMEMGPSHLVISPGPKTPREAGICCELILVLAPRLPILGVCLGHQCIGAAFGARIGPAPRLVHGKTSSIYHDGKTLFSQLPNPMEATRYHSLIIEEEGLPPCLEISAWTEEREIMGVRHREYPTEGVQFHPESILTREGKALLRNFLALKKGEGKDTER